MVALIFLLGANVPFSIAQTESSAIVGVVTKFFAEANAHNIGCGGLGERDPIDQGAASALFVKQPSVTDAFPPWHWEGTTAFKDWMAAAASYCIKHQDAPLTFMVGKPLNQLVEGDRGNVIVPLILDFKEGGKPIRASGVVNVVLVKTRGAWKIGAFTFTQEQ